MEKEILVSICCITYNHEKYIRQALEGFLKQKTNFKYEILIHDDASVDHTADIIREYQEKYPELIKPIYQKENQYSKGIKISATYQYPRARGKYIALCEGDDYWTDEEKLYKQISYMEEHSECLCTFHAADYLYENEIVLNDRHHEYECDIPTEEIIKNGGGYCATASLCFRKEILSQSPQYLQMASVGDYPRQIQLALSGTVHYFPDTMSVYRLFHYGSWGMNTQNIENKKRHYENEICWLRQLDIETNYEYKDGIYYRIIIDMIQLYELGMVNFQSVKKILEDKSIKYGADRRYLRRQLWKGVIKKHFPGLVKRLKKNSKNYGLEA